jgi:hypothetical protein
MMCDVILKTKGQGQLAYFIMPMMAHNHSLKINGQNLVVFDIIRALQALIQARVLCHGSLVEEDPVFANSVQVLSIIHKMRSETLQIESQRLYINSLINVTAPQTLLARWR